MHSVANTVVYPAELGYFELSARGPKTGGRVA